MILRAKMGKILWSMCLGLATILTTCLNMLGQCGAAAAGAAGPTPGEGEHYACSEIWMRGFGFCDQSLPIERRVEILVGSLTLDEKINKLSNAASAVPRLGIPSYQWQNEGLHGVAESAGVSFSGPIYAATSFPQPILVAASFNSSLFNQIGQAISTEARAFHNLRQGGLTYWTPNINVFRDPRWGRGQETPGEDPHLISVYAEYFVRGLQEGDSYHGEGKKRAPKKLKISACCKHFAAYDLENWEGIERYGFNAVVDQQDLDDTFNPPFQSCIQNGRASGLMCSYNSVNGVPSCADPNLLTNIARGQWGFDGYITSDCDSVQTIYANQKYADPVHAVADVLKAGIDVNCGETVANYTGRALAMDLVNETEIDASLTHAFAVQFRLGLFDGNPKDQAYGGLGETDVCSDDHQRLAQEAAAQSFVLLKNDDNALPLVRERIKSLAVIGPNANDSLNTMLGNYAGIACKYVTPFQGLVSYIPATQFVAGCNNGTACETADIQAAASAAAVADATVLVVGIAQEQETEALDRTSLLLPGKQQELIVAVAANAKGPVVLVLMNGGPVDISFAKDGKNIPAILWVGYPGQAGGEALAQIIFGDRNPGGKLPMTWYSESFTSWPMTTMNMRPNMTTGYPGRTYRFYTGEPVYKFGYGLSYSDFEHFFTTSTTWGTFAIPSASQLLCYENNEGDCTLLDSSEAEFCSSLEFVAEVVVSNKHQSRDGSEVVFLFSSPPGAGTKGNALKQLVGFKRVEVLANSAISVNFLVKPCTHLVTTQSDGTQTILDGVHKLLTNNGIGIFVEFSYKQ